MKKADNNISLFTWGQTPEHFIPPNVLGSDPNIITSGQRSPAATHPSGQTEHRYHWQTPAVPAQTTGRIPGAARPVKPHRICPSQAQPPKKYHTHARLLHYRPSSPLHLPGNQSLQAL